MKRYPITAAWATAIDEWEHTLRAAGRSAQTIETRTEHLRRCARQAGATAPGTLSSARLVRWAGSRTWARESRRSMYASLRGFYRWAVETGQSVDDPTEALPSVAAGPAVPRPVSEGDYRGALAVADPRGRVILRLAAEAGLRRAEIAQVGRRDLVSDLGGWTLMVHGKGGRDRLVPLTDSLAREVRARIGAGIWLLPSPRGGHLTPRHVGKIASHALPGGATLHMLRHRFATIVHTSTRDLIVTQRLLGHASVATTQRYVAVKDDALRAGVGAAAI